MSDRLEPRRVRRFRQPTVFARVGVLSLACAGALIVCAAGAAFAQAGASGATKAGPWGDAAVSLRARALRGLSPQVAAMALRGENGGPFAIQALAVPLLGPDGRARVSIFVEIDGATFLDTSTGDLVRGEIYVYAVDGEGSVAGYLAEVFAFDTRRLGEAIWQSGLKYYGSLSLEPKAGYRLRVLVRNYSSAAAALLEVPLDLESPASDQLFPLFPGPRSRDAWMPVRGSTLPTASYPWTGDDRAVSPATKPVLVSGRSSELWLFAHPLPPGELRASLDLRRDGALAASATLEILERHPAPFDGAPESLRVSLETPDLEAGVYDLRWKLDGGGASLRASTARAVVLGAGIREPDLLWTDLRWLLGGREEDAVAARQPSGGASPPKARSKKEKRRAVDKKLLQEIGDQYRRALAVSGSRSGSNRSALFDLESKTLATPTPAALENLRAGELAVVEELAARDVECLVPLMLLHGELYQTYRKRRFFSLVAHARDMVEALAVLYSEKGGTEGSRITASRALASLGGFLQEANLPSSSRRLFQLSLQHDPRNAASLLGLAASYEKYGNYADAGRYLGLLEEVSPKLGEGHLRLAINLRRQGDRLRSQEILEDLTTQGRAPAWVRSLAHQELARGWIDQGSLPAATEVLERALAEGVDSSDTRLLLAYVYDRSGDTAGAFEIIEGVSSSGLQASARQIYDSWPTSALEDQRQLLADAGVARQAILSKLVGGEENGS